TGQAQFDSPPPASDEDLVDADFEQYLVQLTSAGAPDASFDHDGVQLLFDPGFWGPESNDGRLVIDPQTSAIYVAYDQAYHGGETVIARYAPNGSLVWQKTWGHAFFYDYGTPVFISLSPHGQVVVSRGSTF